MIETLLAFALTSLLIELTPGPNMAYIAILSTERGRAAGLSVVAGVALGLAALGLTAGLGLGTAIAGNRWLYETLCWGGVAYLVWLAWDSYRDATRPPALMGAPRSNWIYFRRGLISNALNPKAAIFYVTVMPSFVDVSRPTAGQSLGLVAVYVTVATLVHAAIALAGGALQPFFASPVLRRRLGLAAALLLVGVAAWLAISTGRAWGD